MASGVSGREDRRCASRKNNVRLGACELDCRFRYLHSALRQRVLNDEVAAFDESLFLESFPEAPDVSGGGGPTRRKPIRLGVARSPRAASDQAATPPTTVMNSRRFITAPTHGPGNHSTRNSTINPPCGCPLRVRSGHMQCKKGCPLCPKSGHYAWRAACPAKCQNEDFEQRCSPEFAGYSITTSARASEMSLILPASPSRQSQSSCTARRVGARSATLMLELGQHQMPLFGILTRPEKI